MKRIICTLIVVFSVLVGLGGCAKPLNSDEYSDILIVVYDHFFGRGLNTIIEELSKSQPDGDIRIIFDASAFEEKEIEVFIEFVKKRFAEYPENFILTTTDDKEVRAENIGPEYLWMTISVSIDDGANKRHKLKNNNENYVVVHTSSFYFYQYGEGAYIELKKENGKWIIVNTQLTWIT